MALNYTKKTIDNFLKPKNVGQIDNPDGFAQIGNMVCGDQLDFFLKVEKGKIKDVKFLSFGCASNIATASILTEKVKGLTIEAAKNFNWKQIVKELGGLPNQKVHCSVMAVEGLQKAIANYEKKSEAKKSVAKKITVLKKPSMKKVVAAKKVTTKKLAVKKLTAEKKPPVKKAIAKKK